MEIDFANEVIKASPVAGTVAADVTGRLLFGLSLNDWFYVVVIIYTLIQCWALVYKTLKGGKKDDRKDSSDT